MTPEQIEIGKALGGLSFLPGSWDKRMARSLECMAWMDNQIDLTEKQNEWMFRLLYKYRKQLPTLFTKHINNPYCNKK